MSKEIKTAEEFIKKNYTLINCGKDYVCNHSMQIVGYEDIANEYATIRLKAQESESQKLYEWMLSDKREPAQTYFSSGVIRNTAKEIEFREEKHKEEMEALNIFTNYFFVYSFAEKKWYHKHFADHKSIHYEKHYTFTELIEMFKNNG
jgi:hypothetical protein